MRVLVTGGAGFVGANVVRDLAGHGVEIVVLDDLSVGNPSYLDGLDVELVRGSIADATRVRRAARRCDAIVHLAALSGVAPSIDRPDRDFEVNARGTFTVLDAARRAEAARVVFASSGAVLAGARPPLSEEQVPSPLAPYGASKAYGEAALRAFGSSFGFTGVTLRFSNVYGPWCSHKRSVVAAFVRNALRGRPFVIYGSGRQTRDFLYVGDVARAVRAALTSASTGVFQLGSGVETSINRLARSVAEAAGVRLRVDRRPARPGEARRNYADIERARRTLRFEPRVDLATGLARTLTWMDEHDAPGSGRRWPA